MRLPYQPTNGIKGLISAKRGIVKIFAALPFGPRSLETSKLRDGAPKTFGGLQVTPSTSDRVLMTDYVALSILNIPILSWSAMLRLIPCLDPEEAAAVPHTLIPR